MTREERIAAGWVERWAIRYAKPALWIKKGDYSVGTEKKNERRMFASYDEAWGVAHGIQYPPIVLLRVWTRKRPKPKPELKVGDEVMVKARVTVVDRWSSWPYKVAVSLGSDVWVTDAEIWKGNK